MTSNVNIAFQCTTAQCEIGLGEKVAFRWMGSHGEQIDYTFNALEQESNRFANVLNSLGYHAGDVFFTFLPKMPEQFFSFLGALKMCLITGTLFANFGEDALLDRLGDSGAKGIIIRKSFLKKIIRIRDRLPALEHIIIVDIDGHTDKDILSYQLLMTAASGEFEVPVTSSDTPSVLHYTSGSTGKPDMAVSSQ